MGNGLSQLLGNGDWEVVRAVMLARVLTVRRWAAKGCKT